MRCCPPDSALAIDLNAVYYRHVRDILINDRDRVERVGEANWVSPAHGNVRGSGYYH